jgi:tetratricopeptide (TPR) repeat protein
MKRTWRAVITALHVVVLAVSTMTLPATAQAQAPAAVIELAEKDRAARNATAALGRYEAALGAAPTNYDLLWRAARELVDLGEAATTPAQRTEFNAKAEAYARRAVAANANGADGHFMLSVALGRTAQTVGSRERVTYASEIYDQAAAAVKLDPQHAGALHVLGVWNAEIMRLNGITRFAARNFLGAKVFDRASWADARRYMEAAVSVDPGRITHRLDLAMIYADAGDKAKARSTCSDALQMPSVEFNDGRYKQQCERLLAKLR